MALGAALWGTDGLFRRTLATEVSAPTLVFAKHLVLVVLLAPFLPGPSARSRPPTYVAAPLQQPIGVGASAVAATLFTMAFTQQRFSPSVSASQRGYP